MKLRALLALGGVLATLASANAVDARNRSDSTSRQFTVYCDDTAMRQRVAGFAEEVKADALQLLGATDAWRSPIVITIDNTTTTKPQSVAVQPVKTDGGFKIDVRVTLGSEPAEVNLQKQILRAVLLEYSYRQAGIKPGEHYVEAPWWIMEGALQIFRRRDLRVDTELFKRLIAANQIPPIHEFLVQKPDELGPTALSLDAACAMALVELLVEQPGGRECLGRLVREWPRGSGDPVAALTAAFPSLVDGATAQKWWTLSLARLAAAERHNGLTVEETDRELAEQLRVTLVTNKNGDRETFKLEDFKRFVKLPASRATLLAHQTRLITLSTRANVLLRPVIAEYQDAVALLARGKTHGVEERLAHAATYRAAMLRRLSEIEDYMNWFEATQMGVRSSAFDSFLKTANEIDENDQRASGPISRYLDSIEQEL